MDDTKRLATAIHNLSHILAEIIADHPEPLVEGLTKQETLNELEETVHDVLLPLIEDKHTGYLPEGDNETRRGYLHKRNDFHLKLVKC